MIIALLGLSAEAARAGEITTAAKPQDVSPRIKRLMGDYYVARTRWPSSECQPCAPGALTPDDENGTGSRFRNNRHMWRPTLLSEGTT